MKAAYFALALLALDACAQDVEVEWLPGRCDLPLETGTACSTHQPSTKYAYDSGTKECVSFLYSGCMANGNNFNTLTECENTCKQENTSPTTSSAPPTAPPTPPTLPQKCAPEVSTGVICADAQPTTRYGYYVKLRQCEPFVYRGCGGNENNFDTMVECRKTCEIND